MVSFPEEISVKFGIFFHKVELNIEAGTNREKKQNRSQPAASIYVQHQSGFYKSASKHCKHMPL